METEKYYCKKPRHPCPDSMRMEDEKLWRDFIGCPRICCLHCSKKWSCEFVCYYFEALEDKNVTDCPDQCTIQDKVFGEIFREHPKWEEEEY